MLKMCLTLPKVLTQKSLNSSRSSSLSSGSSLLCFLLCVLFTRSFALFGAKSKLLFGYFACFFFHFSSSSSSHSLRFALFGCNSLEQFGHITNFTHTLIFTQISNNTSNKSILQMHPPNSH